jgi:outer membrane protein OmpA-like peptidoglycan-associated protein
MQNSRYLHPSYCKVTTVQKEFKMKLTVKNYALLYLFLLFCIGISPASAQSTITLDTFDPGNSQTTRNQADSTLTEASIASCLFSTTVCAEDDGESHSFSLDDVVNLGIIDRSAVSVDVDTAEAARQAAVPLPSIDLEVIFEYASDALSGDQIGDLYALARELRGVDFSGRQLVLMGHTDAVGSRLYNRDLSQRRAESVANFLSREANIPRYQIRTTGMGFDYLKYPSDPENGANRRVQILMVEG